jgi:hypothetical protein
VSHRALPRRGQGNTGGTDGPAKEFRGYNQRPRLQGGWLKSRRLSRLKVSCGDIFCLGWVGTCDKVRGVLIFDKSGAVRRPAPNSRMGLLAGGSWEMVTKGRAQYMKNGKTNPTILDKRHAVRLLRQNGLGRKKAVFMRWVRLGFWRMIGGARMRRFASFASQAGTRAPPSRGAVGPSTSLRTSHRAPHADRATWLHKPALLGPLRLLVFAR